ncbi:MAG TPA: AEC family transporter [Paracoccaceae bacterium]|nr:AEC family transporter [Paracoccaceae bacterium]
MIYQILLVVLPVFFVVAAGYAAVRLKKFSVSGIDGLMIFTQTFAIPGLLFRNVMVLDLQEIFDWRLLVSFYTGATVCFFLALFGAQWLFKRRPGEAVAIAMGALYSNTVLLGLPIMQRAYGAESLAPVFAIISIHSAFCYTLAIAAMEVARADGRSLIQTVRVVLNSMLRNALIIGLALGFVVNLSGIVLPTVLVEGIDLLARAGLPAALFALGGVLTRYPITGQLGEAGMVSGLSLIVHPAIAYGLSHFVFQMPIEFVRAAVVTAAMAPGVNVYIFANMYNRATNTAATTVLFATAVSVFSVSAWLWILG